jgi:hypothetical protein
VLHAALRSATKPEAQADLEKVIGEVRAQMESVKNKT